MHKSRVLTAMNWKYAIGEILLIVAGVTIALAANSWYQDRLERREELQVLEQLKQALDVDLEHLETRYAIEKQIHQNVIALAEHMDNGEPYDSSIAPYFRSVRRWVGVRSNSAPYEALKSTGFDLISSESLRLKLIFYYENQFPRVLGAYLNDRSFTIERIEPYYLENFRQTEPGIFVPDDYRRLRDDKYFWNICMTKISRLQNRILPSYEDSLAIIRELLGGIENEFGR